MRRGGTLGRQKFCRLAALLVTFALAAPPPLQAAPSVQEQLQEIERTSGAAKADKIQAFLEGASRNARLAEAGEATQRLIRECVQLADQLRDDARISFCNIRAGNSIYWVEKDPDRAIGYYEKARGAARRANRYDDLFQALYWLGYIQIEKEQLVKGVRYWDEAEQVAASNGDYRLAAIQVIELSRIFAEFNDPLEANRHLEIARKYAARTTTTQFSVGIPLADGQNKLSAKDFQGAQAAYREAVRNLPGLDRNRQLIVPQVWAGLAVASARLGDPKAREYAREARKAFEQDSDRAVEAFVLNAEIEADLAAGDAANAKQRLARLVGFGGPTARLVNPVEMLKLQARVLALQGQYQQAYQALETATEQESDFRRKKALQAAAVTRAQAETKAREAELALAAAQNKLSSEQLKRRTQMLTALAIITLLVALSGGLAFILYRRAAAAARALARSHAEISDQAERLDRGLQEKQMLLREINHRVKNNLQTISSLVEMQAQRLSEHHDRSAEDALREVYGRIETMAILQRQMFGLDSAPNVSIRPFLEEMIAGLVRLFEKPVDAKIAVADVVFDVQVATPVGLIVNELVSNALEHGLGQDGGTLSVSLERTGAVFVLAVSDDGAGAGREFDIDQTQSMGLRLVRSLTAQLRGELQRLPGAQGLGWRIVFPAPQAQTAQEAA